MADGLQIQADTAQVEQMVQGLLNKVERPKPLLKLMQRWMLAVTMKMFRGRRPDTAPVRGVKWPKLKESTIKAKKARVKRGKSVVAARPMVDTAKLRDSIKVLEEGRKGFLFGSRVRSDKNFPYPAHHNAGKFPWLFLTKKDFDQITKMTVDFLKDNLKSSRFYTKG